MLPRLSARLRLGPWQAALAVAAGLILGMVVLGAAAKLRQAGSNAQPLRAEAVRSCSSGDDVADFVCRNTWLGQHRHAYR